MPINWSDNKVFNTTGTQPQRNPAYRPMTTTMPQGGMQMPRSTQTDMMTGEQMMGDQMMGDQMMSDQMGDQMGQMRTNDLMNNAMMFQEGPPPTMDKTYLAGYLKSNIGKGVRAEFPLPGGFYIDKSGILRDVGVNYFVLEDFVSKAKIVCDLYSVKFVTML